MSTTAQGTLLPGFDGTTLPEWVKRRLTEGLAGVCLFGNNIDSLEQLGRLTAEILAANPLAIIAIDEEGGDVTRLFYDVGSPFPGNAILGRIDDQEYTAHIAESVGWALRRVGCTLTLAPDVDVNSNAQNPVIGVRSFGADATLVARHAAAWVRGIARTGIAVSAKHFPGHGDTAQDSHLALPVVDLPLETLRARELIPFRAAIEAGAETVMTSHILLPQLDPDLPATLSPAILQGLLRSELGFDGVIVSDALDMAGASAQRGIPEAAVMALAAGCDLLCIGTFNTDEQLRQIEHAIGAAVSDGRLAADRLTDAAARVRKLAQDGVQRRAQTPVPESASLDFDLARTAGAFDVQPNVRVEPLRHVVALDTVANMAVGVAPWAATADRRIAVDGELGVVPGGRQLVLIGRDNHRHPWVRRLIDQARRGHATLIVVDMGWPSDDRAYADIATFGAAAHVTAALDAWLASAGSGGNNATTSSDRDGTQ